MSLLAASFWEKMSTASRTDYDHPLHVGPSRNLKRMEGGLEGHPVQLSTLLFCYSACGKAMQAVICGQGARCGENQMVSFLGGKRMYIDDCS